MQQSAPHIASLNTDDIITGLYKNYYANLKSKAAFSSFSFEERADAANEMVNGLKRNELYFYRRTYENFIKPSNCNDVDYHFIKPVNLASNDYLGFTQHPYVINTGIKEINEHGAGAGSVPMLSGTTPVHKHLEAQLASFLGYESLLTFSSCYAANHGLLTALLTNADVAILDIAVHASVIDGCCNTNIIFFKHNDISSLKIALMKASSYKNKLVIVDGVYSMDGDVAKIAEIIQLTKDEDAWLMIDDSHAIGVLGENGKGSQSYFGVRQQAEIVTGSLGKAMGGIGGYAAGSEKLMRLLEICCRPFIFSTSIPQNVAAQITAGINLLETDGSILEKLWWNINYFKEQVKKIGFNTGQSASAIIPVIIPDEVKLLNFCRFLHDNYVFVNPIFYPVVSKRKSRIRISITALLEKHEMDYALDKIEAAAHHFQIT